MDTRLSVIPRLIVVLGVSLACGQPSKDAAKIEAPVGIVAEYLVRDSRGERLQPTPWFRSVSAWEDEPAWDAITLIRSFRVGHGSINADSARIEVTYEVLAGLEGTPEGTPMQLVRREEIQRVEFVLVSVQGQWLIAFPSVNPHVLADSIVAYRPGILSPKDAARLDSLLRSQRE